MPKQGQLSIAPRKRGRKRKHGRTVGRRRSGDMVDNSTQVETDHFEESITAQTATNLKAFRFLFGSHEETEEEFEGYYLKEIGTITAICKRKRKKVANEIAYLEALCLAQGSASTTQSAHAPASLIVRSTPSAPIRPVVNHKMPKATERLDTEGTSSTSNSAFSSDLNFPGFSESDPLQSICRNKSRKLLKFHEDCEIEEQPETVDRRVAADEIVNASSEGRTRTRISSIRRKFQPTTLQDFILPQSIAGEITVTPILQSDASIAVKLTHSSPFLVSCLPKT